MPPTMFPPSEGMPALKNSFALATSAEVGGSEIVRMCKPRFRRNGPDCALRCGIESKLAVLNIGDNPWSSRRGRCNP